MKLIDLEPKHPCYYGCCICKKHGWVVYTPRGFGHFPACKLHGPLVRRIRSLRRPEIMSAIGKSLRGEKVGRAILRIDFVNGDIDWSVWILTFGEHEGEQYLSREYYMTVDDFLENFPETRKEVDLHWRNVKHGIRRPSRQHGALRRRIIKDRRRAIGN